MFPQLYQDNGSFLHTRTQPHRLFFQAVRIPEYHPRPLPSQQDFNELPAAGQLRLHGGDYHATFFTGAVLHKSLENFTLDRHDRMVNYYLFSWIWLSMDFIKYDDDPPFRIITVFKILLALRIIELFELLRNPFEDFITTIPDLGKVYFPLLIFMTFYAILGLILFSGATEYKCR